MDLDQFQQAAVTTASRNALVIAPPGGGKTRVIIERAAYLIEHCQASPYELLLVTFTRHAAQEMRTRLVDRIGPQAHHVTIGTFHSVALNLLHRFGDIIGFHKENSTIYSAFEEQFLLLDVGQEMGLHNGKKWKVKKEDVEYVFQHYYQTGEEPEEYDPLHDLFRAFIQRTKENNSYTFGSLLTGLMLLLPSIHQYLEWKHIILDEAHDTDRLQWYILNAFKEYCKTSLFVVTDLDQSIYSWRGAYPEYILQHQSEFDLFILENNYRSLPEIVDASNRLIRHNTDRIDKTMVATRESAMLSSPVQIHKEIDSEALIPLIQAWHVEPDPGVTVLARNHFLLEKLSRLLSEGGIAHNYVGQTTALTNSEEFRRFHAFLKLLVNPFDNFSFLLIKDLMDIKSDEYLDIRARAAKEGKSHFDSWMRKNEFMEGFVDVGTMSDTAKHVFEYLGNRGCQDVFAPTMAFISQYQGKDVIEDYLNWLALYEIQDEIKENDGGIALMTIHAAKGLEWPTVILAGCNEGIIPSKHACDNDEIEAERRLMYVAMTRARDQLIFTVRPERTEKDGRLYESPRSRFLGEII